MCNWKFWLLPGLLTVALLTAAAAFLRAGPIERDLAARAGERLDDRHPWAAVALDGRDLVLTGTAPEPGAIDKAAAIAAETPGVRTVSVRADTLPLQDPFVLSVDWKDGVAILEGFAPDAAAREAIAAAAQAAIPDARIDNRLELARGAPDGFAGLAAFTLAQLSALAEGRIELSGTDISVVGTARSPAGYENAIAALSGGLPGATVSRLEIAPASVSPFAWSVARSADAVTLDGFAPSAADRDAVLDAVHDAFPDARIDGGFSVAGGLDGGIDWQAASRFMLAQLAGLSQGTVSVSDGAMNLDGRATDSPAHERITAALAADLPAGLELAGATVRLPVIDPYDWSLTLSVDGDATLAGHVPDRETGARLAESVRSALPGGGRLVDNQLVGAGAPEGFEQAATQAAFAALRLSGGHVAFFGTELTVGGEALTGPSANEIGTGLRASLPQGFALDTAIGVKPVGAPVDGARCQQQLGDLLAGNAIGFDTASAAIAPASFGLLDRLAYVMRHCPAARVEIGGHTDSDGSDEANLVLSAARAESVVAYLVRAGILQSRLSAKGYGESMPIADNSTEAGREQNRRIEFRVLP